MRNANRHDADEPLLARAEQVARLGTWRYELSSGQVSWSDGMYRIFMVDPEDPATDLTAAMVAAVHPHDRERVQAMIVNARSAGKASAAEFRVLLADGGVRWVAGETRQQLDADGAVAAIGGVIQDVTETKRAAEFLARDAALDRAVAWLSKAMVAADPSIDEISDAVLADARDLTGSPYGLIAPCDPQEERAGGCMPRGDMWIIESAEEGVGAEAPTRRQWGWFTKPEDAFRTNATKRLAATAENPEGGVITCLLRAPAIAEGRFVGQIALANAPGGYDDGDLATVKRLASLFAIALVGAEERAALRASESSLRESNRSLEGMVYGVSEAMGRIVEARDPYTQGHEVRVAKLAKQIATQMGLSDNEIEGIEMSGLVHDIGKLSVPAEILTKPGRISDVEFALIKEHSEAGYTILNGIDFPWPVADIVLSHHERWDGSGYPKGLKGEEIPLASRILMVADVVEAMASHRPYRPALGLPAAVAELQANAGKYDPAVVRAFMTLYESGSVHLDDAV